MKITYIVVEIMKFSVHWSLLQGIDIEMCPCHRRQQSQKNPR